MSGAEASHFFAAPKGRYNQAQGRAQRRPGSSRPKFQALKGRNNLRQDVWWFRLCRPFRALGSFGLVIPGRRCALPWALLEPAFQASWTAGKVLFLVVFIAFFFVRPIHAEESNSVTLAQYFAEVISSNAEILTLRKDVERAAGTKLELRSPDLPHLSAQLSTGWRAGPLYGDNSAYALTTAQFSQALFNTGIAATWRRGQCEVIAAQQALNVSVSDRLHELRDYYLRTQRLEQLIALYEEIDQRLQTNVVGEQQRRDIGTTGPRPLLQARVQLLSERADLTAYRREEFEMRTRMAELMGRSMGRLPRPAGTLEHETVTLDLPKEAKLALERRADLKLLRALIQITAESRRMVDAGYFPFVSLVGSTLYIPGKKQLTAVSPIIEGQTPLATEGRYGVSATWQIVDNGRVTGVSREIEAVRQEYVVTLRQLEENIPRQLARAGHALEDADARLAALKKSQAEAEEYLRDTESRVSLGEATQLDFSDAQRHLLAVRGGIVEALFQYDSALAELDWITGRYLEFAAPAPDR
jgi:outer membrane protein TolC